MAAGVPARIERLLAGYGYARPYDPQLARRLMILTLLHRFSDPQRQIRIDDWQRKAPDLPALQRLLWPI